MKRTLIFNILEEFNNLSIAPKNKMKHNQGHSFKTNLSYQTPDILFGSSFL